MVFPLNVYEEEIIRRQVKNSTNKIDGLVATATPELAERVAQIYRNNRQLPAGVVLASAQANLTDEQIKPFADKTALTLNAEPDVLTKNKKSFIQRNFVDKLKATSRYTFAGLELSTQLIQNTASQIFSKNENGIDGWFISTDLGSMLANDEEAGEGWLLGGKAKQAQIQRVQNFRGKTTGGNAWSVGRGLAGMIFTEDAMAYNLLSGLVDGAISLSTPVIPGFKPLAQGVKAAAGASQASDVVKKADEVFDVLRGKGTKIPLSEVDEATLKQARIAAGLLGNKIDVSDANKFLGSKGGMRLVERLVDANTAEAVRKEIGNQVFPETVLRIRNAKTDAEVQDALLGVLGVAGNGLTRTKLPGTKVFRLSNTRRVAVVDNLVGLFEDSKAGRVTQRAFDLRPSGKAIDFSSDNPVDVRRTLNDLDRWMSVSLINSETKTKFLDNALESLVGDQATPTARRALKKEFLQITKQSFIDNGVDANVANAVMNGHIDSQAKLVGYNASIIAQLTDGGFFDNVHAVKPAGQSTVFGSALMQSELGTFSVEMPDIRQVRALTSKINKIWRKNPTAEFGPANFTDENIGRLSQAGELRVPLAFIEFFQDSVFKKLVTATFGFGARNLLEGQISAALSQKSVTSIFRHPIQHMQWMAHGTVKGTITRKGIGDIMGREFEYVDGVAQKGMAEYQHSLGVSISSVYATRPDEIFRRGKRIGQFSDVVRGKDDPRIIIEAHGDQIGRMNADPVMRQIAAGSSDDEIVAYVRTNDEGKKWFRDQQDYHINGRPVLDQINKRWSKVSVDLNEEHNLRLLINNNRDRFDSVVGNHGILRNAVANGQLEKVTVDANKLGWSKADRGTIKQVPVGKRVMDVRVDANDENIVRPFAFYKGEMTKELADTLKDPKVFNDPNVAQFLTHETRQAVNIGKRGISQELDAITDKFFGFVSRKPTAYLERAPAFKQRYFNWALDEMVTSLSPDDLNKLIVGIEKRAALNNISASDYVGDNKVFTDMVSRLFKPTKPFVGDRWQRILDLQANPKRLKGTLTLEEVDEFAKLQAMDDLSKMFYDATERTNLTDVMRVLAPFGQAQVEFFRRISRIYTVETPFSAVRLPNLNALRKTQIIVESAKEADPDNDGRGIVYTDPQTGEWSFDYPFSEGFNHLITGVIGGGPGVKSTFQSPVKGLLMGLDVRPGVGPVVQIVGSSLMKNAPQFDLIKSVILPYGETDLKNQQGPLAAVAGSVTPAYLKKIFSAITDSPDSATVFGNTYAEVYQALSTSGEYDLTSPLGRDQLATDAESKARFLTILRGIGQFLGPSRPTNKMSVETKQGDVFVNVLSMRLRELQLEDYDTAIPRWIDEYGEDVFVYLSGKTKAVYGGLQASKQFGDFERANKDLFRKYKGVAGFFVEGGTDLDWQVYSRQLETGQRERLSPEEMLFAAQKYLAYSQYRQVQDLIGPYPNGDQKDYLRDFREYLGEKYPGFTSSVYDPNKMKNQIRELQDAIQDPNLADNDVAEASRKYFEVREAVLAEAANRGLEGIDRSKNASDLRGYLRQYAITLKEQYPNFSRLYDRLLLQEVDE